MFCEDNAINCQHSVPYEQYQNGMAEAAVDTLSEKMRAFLLQSGLPQEFWGFALKYAVACHNHLLHSTTGQVPILVHGQAEHGEYFRTFGCYSVVLEDKVAHGKLSPRGIPGIFVCLAFQDGQKAWLMYIPKYNKVV